MHMRTAPFLPPSSRYIRFGADGPPPRSTLGNLMPILGAAAAAYGGGGAGAPGATSPVGAPASPIAVSPSFQTQISPQISPVFSQMQDSAGASQGATATQYMPGGMQASTGGAYATPSAPLPSSAPLTFEKPGGLPASPLDPLGLTDIRTLPTGPALINEMRATAPFNWTPVLMVAALAAVGVLVYTLVSKRRG